MKDLLKSGTVLFALVLSSVLVNAQTAKVPGACKMYLEEKVVAEISVEDAIKWCELTPPTVQCDDGKIYKLETFAISFLTLKPFMSQDFGIGERGVPIRARSAIKNAKPGDTFIMKEATYIDVDGTKKNLPVISFKLK